MELHNERNIDGGTGTYINRGTNIVAARVFLFIRDRLEV